MAGVQWSGGKLTRGALFGALMHDDREQRLMHEHSNEDIDLSLTPGNWSVLRRGYAEKLRYFEQRMSEVEYGRESSGSNERVVAHDLIVYCPPEVEAQGMKAVRKFMRFAYGTLAELVGVENVIDMDVHVDEKHPYVDPDTGEIVMSRIHGHFKFMPVVTEKDVRRRERVQAKDDAGNPIFETVTDEDGTVHQEPVWERDARGKIKRRGGKVEHVRLETPELNESAVATRANMRAANDAMDAMCKEHFGCTYTTGKGRKRRGKTVEQLKIDSALAADKAAEDAEARRAEAEDQLGEQAAGLVDATARFAELQSELDVVAHDLDEASDELELARKDASKAKNDAQAARRRTEGLEKRAQQAIADRDKAQADTEALRASADAYAAKVRADADEAAQKELDEIEEQLRKVNETIDALETGRSQLAVFVRALPNTIRRILPDDMPEKASKAADFACNWLERVIVPRADKLIDQHFDDLRRDAARKMLKLGEARARLRERQMGPSKNRHAGTKTGPIRTQQQAQRSRNRSHGGPQLGR